MAALPSNLSLHSRLSNSVHINLKQYPFLPPDISLPERADSYYRHSIRDTLHLITELTQIPIDIGLLILSFNIPAFDPETVTCMQILKETGLGSINCLCSISPSDHSGHELLISGSDPDKIIVWDLNTGSIIANLEGHVYSPRAILSFDAIAISASFDSIRVWDMKTFECVNLIKDTTNTRALCVVNHPIHGKLLVSGSGDSSINFWMIFSGKWFRTLFGHSHGIYCLTSLNEYCVASGAGDKTIKIWNWHTSKCMATLEGHEKSISALCVLNPNILLASASQDGTVRIWQWRVGKCVRTLNVSKDPVLSLALLPSSLLATGSFDERIRIWNIDSGAMLRELEGHTFYVSSLCVLPNGWLCSGSGDMTLRLFGDNDELDDDIIDSDNEDEFDGNGNAVDFGDDAQIIM